MATKRALKRASNVRAVLTSPEDRMFALHRVNANLHLALIDAQATGAPGAVKEALRAALTEVAQALSEALAEVASQRPREGTSSRVCGDTTRARVTRNTKEN